MDLAGVSEQWFQDVARTAEFVTLMDDEERLLYVNHPQPGCEDYVGQSIFDFVDPNYHEVLRQSVSSARAEGGPQHYDSEAAGPNGQVSLYSNWVIALSGKCHGLVAFIATDVTYASRIEEKLAISEVTFSSVVENSPDSILIVDRERRIQFINRLEHGFEMDRVLGQPAELFVPENDRAEVVAAVEHVLRTGETTSYETHLDAPAGTRRFRTRVAAIPNDGNVDRVMMVATDVTAQQGAELERRRMAEQLQQAQKMEAIGQLTGGVAHDFNNLLTAISGNLELARLNNLGPDERDHHLSEALEAVRRGSTLTQQLLAFSRRQTLRPQAVDASSLIALTQPMLQRMLGETIDIRVRNREDLWTCRVDPGQLENALLNLAVNARDAMPRGGELVIECSNITTTGNGEASLPAGDYVKIIVKDCGEGMTPEVAAQAFEPFFTTKEVGRGSGLGLSMVHGFVHQSGGHVELSSEPNVGTSVVIFLPADRTDAPTEVRQARSGQRKQGKGERVLVVEDNDQLRDLTVRILESLGYRAEAVVRADLALDRITRKPSIELLFSDVVLPGGMSGFELAAQLRSSMPELPVVFVSGYPTEAGQRGEHYEVLQKPYTTEELARTVRQAFTGRGPTRTGGSVPQ